MPRAQGCAGAADSRNRLTEQVAKDADGNVLTRFTYTLDDTGRRTKLEEASGRVTEWQYDDLYRLTQETINDPVNGNRTASYTYDKVGNRLTETVNGVTTSYSYDDNDRLTQKGGTSYSHDANGNTVSEDDGASMTSYSYDARDKLTEVTKPSEPLRYDYDINGIRTEKSAGGTTTNYVVDHNRRYAQVLAERENGTLARSYTYGNDLVSQQTPGGQERFYIYDGLGSTRALADGSGSVTDTYDYEAFGELTQSSGSTENSYRFTGEQYDASLDQYYLRARYYAPETGRFARMDEWLGEPFSPVSLNKYTYGRNNPVNYTDPSGNVSLRSIGAAFQTLGNLLSRAKSVIHRGTIARVAHGLFNKRVNVVIRKARVARSKNKGKSDVEVREMRGGINRAKQEFRYIKGRNKGQKGDGVNEPIDRVTVRGPSGEKASASLRYSKTTKEPTIEISRPAGRVKVRFIK